MKAFGRHLLAEYKGCKPEILDDISLIESAMRDAATAAEATIVASVFHPFSPQGVTGVVVVEESHLSIHTWPEHGYAAVDFYTCGDCLPERAADLLNQRLRARSVEIMYVDRGIDSPVRSIAVRDHKRLRVLDGGPDSSDMEPSVNGPLEAARSAARSR